ncbi:MAG: flippase-like domain-containing protein [Tannerellaceae bacterium]|jgi:uncharacterized protein (TIRG00374 family)|nr:flippase-like domain-containing protein [Tannerellaceae bacterium]
MLYKKILNTTIKIFLPLALGFALLWYLYRDMNFSKIWESARSANYGILLLSLLFGVTANTIRAFRWGILIDALGERYRTKNLIFAVLGNYAINYALPRVGEVWRCGIIAKYEKILFAKLLGTLLVDRVADTLTVGLMALSFVAINFGFVETYIAHNPSVAISFPESSSVLWLLLVGAIMIAAVWFAFARLGHLSIVQKIKGILLNIWEGIKSVWRMERKWLFLLQTLMLWTLYYLYFYTTFYAFDFTSNLGYGKGFIAFTMSSIGVAAPVQGGIGAWHFMVISTLLCFGVLESEAAAFAFVVYSLQSVWTILCGLFGIVALPIANRKQSGETEDTPEN